MPTRNEDLPNILFLVFDTLSARHLTLFGYDRDTTPNMARFAERSNVYHAHYAAGNFTSPGTASLLTGTYPWTHRSYHIQGSVRPEMVNRNLFHLMAGGGYSSLAYTHNPAVSVLLHQFKAGIDRLIPTKDLALLDPRIVERVFPQDYNVAYAADSAYFFGNGEVRPTSLSPDSFQTRQLNLWRRLYDEYISYVDAEFGRLYDGLEQSGNLDDTVLILTSDHTDILPNLLHLAGLAIPAWCEGQILPPFSTIESDRERAIFTVEAKQNSNDPNELENLFGRDRSTGDELANLLNSKIFEGNHVE